MPRKPFNPIIPPELLVPKKIARAPILTTSTAIGTRAAKPSSEARTVEEVPVVPVVYSTPIAGRSAGPPKSPTLLAIAEDFQPAAGVYLLASPTGSGKTALSLGIVSWCNAMRVPASYFSVFEPRCPVQTGNRFTQPLSFLDDLEAAITDKQQSKLIIFDSATLPLKAYAKNFQNQATFTGGSQPSDRGFIDEAERFALSHNTCLVLVLNSTLIPYVADLAGAAEGLIRVSDVGSFTVEDRTAYSKRRAKLIRVPNNYVNAALKTLGFGEYSPTTLTDKLGYSGF